MVVMQGVQVARRMSMSVVRERIVLAARALRAWGPRRYLVAAAVAAGFGTLLGISTVLIPNPMFTREIGAVWWNYPVWALTSVGAGLLAATYLRVSGTDTGELADTTDRRTTRMGIVGGVLSWFAVGCPVCNKIALLALGYSGAMTWFAPAQPVLALLALLLTGVALVSRLSGQVACPVEAGGSAPQHPTPA